MFMKSIKPLVYVLLIVCSALTVAHAANNGQIKVKYDKNTDLLSLKANDVSYRMVLAKLATLSGIEVRIDPAVDHKVTADYQERKLEYVLKAISRDTSYSLRYADATNDQQALLIGIDVLPKGQHDGDFLPILNPVGEAFIRQKNRRDSISNIEKPSIMKIADQRWQARLDRLPVQQRDELLKQADEKLKRLDERSARREKQREEHAKRRAERRQQHLDRLEELRLSNPEAYEARVQVRRHALPEPSE